MISGKKVGLRAVESHDLQQLMEWRNQPDFRKNFREHREINMENQRTWFQSVSANKNDFMFSIVELETGMLIGACGLLYTNWILRSSDFSFYIGKDSSYVDSDGLADESASLLLTYGFECLNLNKVWMELYEFDSQKLEFFQGLGFQIDGKLRANAFEEGKYWDSFILSMLLSDWETCHNVQ